MQTSKPKERKTSSRPKLIIFASGSKTGAGSGFEKLVEATKPQQRGEASLLDAEIVAVVSNHKNGGVRERADRLGIPFIHFNCRTSDVLQLEEYYRKIVKESGAEWVALSGWLKMVKGLDPSKTFNIHPALLSQLGGRFGGPGMWGHHVHEAVKEVLDRGEITESGLTMHFVTDEYDRGPAFFEYKVPLSKGMSADQIGELVNKAEHQWQPIITNKIIHGEIAYGDFVA